MSLIVTPLPLSASVERGKKMSPSDRVGAPRPPAGRPVPQMRQTAANATCKRVCRMRHARVVDDQRRYRKLAISHGLLVYFPNSVVGRLSSPGVEIW
jgi:hypothetical protein